MSSPEIATNIGGGSQSGIFGAASVSGAIFNIYNYSSPTPAAETDLVTDAIGPCPFPGLFYFGPADKDTAGEFALAAHQTRPDPNFMRHHEAPEGYFAQAGR